MGLVLLAVLAAVGVTHGQTFTSYFTRVVIASSSPTALTSSGGASFGGPVRSTAATPDFRLYDSDEAADGRMWLMVSNVGAFEVRAYDDAVSASTLGLRLARTGTTMGALTLGSTALLNTAGGESAPAYSFSADPDTGWYQDTTNTLMWTLAGVHRGTLIGQSLVLTAYTDGAGANTGRRIYVGNNTSGSGAAGCIELALRDSSTATIYASAGSLFRTAGGCPSENGAHDGAVIGDQTSFLAEKDLLGQPTDASLLDAVLRTPVHHFAYKDGRYNGETFTGIVTDEAPWFGKDQNRALNEINGLGYLIGAVRELERRLAASEARVRELEARK